MLLPVMAHLSIKRWTNLKKQDDNVADREIRGKWNRDWVLRFSWGELDDCTHVLLQSHSLQRLLESQNLLPLFMEQQTAFSTHSFPWMLLTLLLPEVWKHNISHPTTSTVPKAQRWKGCVSLDRCRQINLNMYFGHTFVSAASWGVGNYSVT